MGFYSTVAEPQKVRQEKLTCTQKPASREIFCYPIKSSPKNRLETPELHQRNRPTATKIASGILYWPSRDPIEEGGGANLYSSVGNDPISWIDYLGMNPQKPQNEAPQKPTPPEGKGDGDFNCAGLAFGDFEWYNSEESVEEELSGENCREIKCSEKCVCPEKKFIYWKWIFRVFYAKLGWGPPSTDPDRGPFPSRKKPTLGFHIISHPANATTCYAKTTKGPIRGPSSERPPENEYVYGPKRDVWVIKTREVTEKCYCCKENSSESK